MAKETNDARAKRLNSNKLITKRKTKPTVKSGLTGAKRTRKVDNPNSLTDVSQITSSTLKKIAGMRHRNKITLKDAINKIVPNATQKMKVAIAGMIGTAVTFDTPKEFSRRNQSVAKYYKPNTRKPGMEKAKAMEASKKRKKAATRTKKK